MEGNENISIRCGDSGNETTGNDIYARRSFIKMCGMYAVAPLGVLFGGRLTGARASPGRQKQDNLAQVLSTRSSAISVGAAYLARAPDEADSKVVIERMRKHCDALVGALEAGSPCQVRKLAVRDMRADFANGRIVRVDGWLLSQTESRLR